MILDWLEVTVVAESPVWTGPGWTGEGGPGLVRWVTLRGHTFLAVAAILHAALLEAVVQHQFAEFVQLLTSDTDEPSAAGHDVDQPTATGHDLDEPSVTGHEFIPLE